MNLHEFLEENSIVYITRTMERAVGISPCNGYHIITNNNPAAQLLTKEYPYNALLIKEKEELETYKLLEHKETIEYIKKLKNPHIVVFKNTPQIERIAKTHGFIIANPSASLADTIEGKISQVSWLGELSSLLPPHEITLVKDISFNNAPYIIQFNHGHTGSSTLLINTEKELENLKAQFPERQARKTNFLKGHVYTNNNCVTSSSIIKGTISFQITGLKPFTDFSFSTIGNDWALPHKTLSQEQRNEFFSIAEQVGKKMQSAGWKGLFGIDVLVDNATGKLFLIEINARQPASSTFESLLQKKKATSETTLMETHLSALFGLTTTATNVVIDSGAQILQRVTPEILSGKTFDIKKLTEKNLRVIEYKNTHQNDDFLRIQSDGAFMETPDTFNELGLFIQSILS